MNCNCGVLKGEDEHTSYSAIFPALFREDWTDDDYMPFQKRGESHAMRLPQGMQGPMSNSGFKPAHSRTSMYPAGHLMGCFFFSLSLSQ